MICEEPVGEGWFMFILSKEYLKAGSQGLFLGICESVKLAAAVS
jgi:hypothetical protein